MKNLITYLKTLWSWVADSQSSDVRVDRRRSDLRRSPSGLDAKWKQNPFMRFAVVLTLIFTIGSGNVWGATRTGWTRVTSVAEITAGGTFIVGWENSANSNTVVPMINKPSTLTGTTGNNATSYLYSGTANASNNTTINMSDNGSGATTNYEFEFVAGSSSGTIAIKLSDNTYVGFYGSSNNNCRRYASVVANASFTPTISSGIVTLTNVQYNSRKLSFNNNSSSYRFSNYSSSAKIVLYKKSSSCSNSVGVTKGSESHGEVTTIGSASVATCSGTASDRQVTITVTPDDCYDAPSTLTWTKSSGTVSASKQSGPTDNGDGTYSYVYQFAQNDNGAGTFGVTCTAKAAGKTVNFDAGPGVSASSSLTETCDGSGVTLPAVTASGVCKGWTTFAGWATAAVSDSTTTSVTVYSAGSKYTPASNNMTLYAVYSKTKGGGSGFKLSLNSGGTDYYVGAKGSGSYMSAVTDAADAVVFTFANGYLSYDNSGTKTYISSEGNNTTLTVGTSVPSSTWTESGTTTYTYQSSATGNRYLGFNSGTSPVRFAPYGSTYAHEFTKHSLSTTYYCSDPNCCTQLGSINGSVTLSQLATPNPTKLKATWSMNATTGIASYDLEVYNSSNVKVKTINNYTSGDEITGLDPCTTYYVKLYTVSSGSPYCDGGLIGTSSSVTTNGYTYTINPVNVSLKDGETEATNSCEDFMAEYVADAGYDLPTTISVTGASSYTWEDGVLMIDKADVTGNVTVTITGTAQSNFINGETVFIQADSKDYSAWKDDACVKAWFNNNWSGGSAETTYWLFDATDTDAGKKLFATVVPASGDLNIVQLQRFAGNCSDKWNDNGSANKASSNGVNTFRSYGSADNNVAWNGSSTILYLYGSQNSWESSLGTFADQGAGVWTATISNYAPDATSKDYKIKTSYNNGWIGNTGSNNNATLSGMIVGSTYNVTATLNVTDHSLVMSKTFVKGEVSFDLQGHGSAISKLTNVAAGSKISAPSPAPSATGWDFGGWFKEPACTNEWNFASDEVNETTTLYAKWTKHTYTITSTLTNCSASPSIPSSYEYTGTAAGLSYTITPSPGYRLPTEITVSGTTYTWNPATGALALTGTISSNVTITIVAIQTHTVDWYVGGSAPANKIGDDGQTTVVDHGGKIEDFPATTPDGTPCDKTFVGWTNTSSYEHGTSPLFTDVAGSPTINADASFYAVFATGGGDDFELVTAVSQLHVGDVVTIANFVGNSESGAVIKAYNSGNNWPEASASTDASGKISGSTTDMQTFTLEEGSVDDTWAFNDGTGYPYAASSNKNYMWRETTKSANSSFEITIDGTSHAAAFVAQGTNTRNTMRYNSGSSIFSCYDPVNSQSDIYIYRKPSATGHTINCADCGTSVTPTYTASPTGGTVSVTKNAAAVASGSTVKTCTAVDLTVTITPATHYDLTGFTATGLTTGTATITPAVGSTLPVSVAQTFTVTVSAGATGTLTLAPTFTAQTPLSITLETHSKGTFTPIGDIYSGESFTFPTVTPSDAECSSFLGWIEGTTFVDDGTETDPTAITGLANYHAAGSSSGTLTTTKTYTAVFGEKDTQVVPAYQKVTSAPSNWSGDYLIVRDDNSRAFDGSLSTLDAADNYIGVTISDGSITANSTVNASKWTIAKVGETSNYTIKSASGYYIGRTANSNGLNSSTSEAYTNTLSYSDDHVVITSSGGPTLQMNSGTRFRYYTTSQQALQLYKYNPDAEVVSYTYTTNPACTPRYRVTISSATGGSPEADKTYEHADETITITANPAAGYSFTSWTITKTTGGDNVTSTLLTGDKPTTANTTFTMPAYDITIAATYTKKMVSTLEVKDGATVVSTTIGPVSGTVNISTGANKTLDVVITPSDAYDHSWTATVSAGSTYASITNVTDDGFRVNGLAQGDATITVNAPNDGSAKSVTLTVQVRDIMPEEIILKRDGSNTPIETLIMYYDETNSKGQYVKVNVGYSPANPTNKAFTFSSALTGKVGSHSHAPASGYEVLVANGVTSDAVNCTFTSSADGSVTKVLAVTVLPILSDRFVDYVHGNATQTVSARLSDDRYSIIPDINTPSLSDASDANPTSEDCETSHYHLVGWLPQTTAEALWAAGTPITDATEGLVRAGESVEATGQTWCAIWAEEAE